jgi:hypothetical protein
VGPLVKQLETGEWQGAGLFSDEALFCRQCVAFVGAGAELTPFGVIIGPVKFEGANIAVFHAYHVMREGGGDEYLGSFRRAGNVLCSERYDGFVNGVVCDTETSAIASWKLLSESQARSMPLAADIAAPRGPVMDAARSRSTEDEAKSVEYKGSFDGSMSDVVPDPVSPIVGALGLAAGLLGLVMTALIPVLVIWMLLGEPAWFDSSADDPVPVKTFAPVNVIPCDSVFHDCPDNPDPNFDPFPAD